MKLNMAAVTSVLLAVSAVFAEETPQSVKYFADWIPLLEFDSTNGCYVAQYDPDAYQHAYVHTSRVKDYIKVQPGERYSIVRSERARFTQHQGVGCTVTFTNGVSELNGVSLPSEFGESERQLLIQGNYEVGYRDYKKYAFVVNAEGEAYDVGTRKKFHFGIPFHAPKPPPRIDPDAEKIQDTFRKEGVDMYKRALAEPRVKAMKDALQEGGTNVVDFVVETGGVGNLSERERKYIIKRDPDAARLFAMLEANRSQDRYAVFCAKEDGLARIVAVGHLFKRSTMRFWTYSKKCTPEFVYLGDCQGTAVNYYEYGEDGLLLNFCVVSNDGVDYRTIKGGVLQKSSDLQKAHAFMSRVEEIFNRYVELDTTGTLKPFVEKLRTQGEEAKAQQEKK